MSDGVSIYRDESLRAQWERELRQSAHPVHGRIPPERWASPDYEQFHRPLCEVFVENSGRFVIPAPDAMRAEDV